MHSARLFCLRAEADKVHVQFRWFFYLFVWGLFFFPGLIPPSLCHWSLQQTCWGGCDYLFSQCGNELQQQCSHRAQAWLFTPTHLRAQMHLHSCLWTTLFRQKKFLMGIHRTGAILLLCTGSAMQDFVLSAFVFTVLWLLAESLDNDNLSQGPENPESRDYPSLIDTRLIKYLNKWWNAFLIRDGPHHISKCLFESEPNSGTEKAFWSIAQWFHDKQFGQQYHPFPCLSFLSVPSVLSLELVQ